MNPKISIVMPSYNYGQFIGRAINSILDQTYENFELIVVDDFSSDNTSEIVNSFKDERIKYIKNEKNIGLTKTWNKGMKITTEDYCCYLDADDTFPKDSLEIRVDAIEGYDTLLCDITSVTNGGETYIPESDVTNFNNVYEFLHNKEQEFSINLCSCLHKRNLFDSIGYRDEDYSTHADFEFILRLILNTKTNVLHKSVYNYFRHADSMNDKAFVNSDEVIICEDLIRDYSVKFKNELNKKRVLLHTNISISNN